MHDIIILCMHNIYLFSPHVQTLASCFMQYHRERIASRNKGIVSTATNLSLPGFSEGPFDELRVSQFLQDFSQHRKEAKEKAETEKVS